MSIIFSHTQGLDPQASSENSPTLRSGGGGMAVMVIPIDDAEKVIENKLITYSMHGAMIGRKDTAGPSGSGFQDENDPSYTIDTVSNHGVVIVKEQKSTVRRLTPVECERLQGFPDNWTEGQADTHRYKQMGNAVAVPVVSWLVNRLMEVANDLD